MIDKEDAKMTLEKTVEMMTSDDYNEHFKAEYFQLTVRLDKLNAILDKWRKNELDFTPKCPFWLLSLQSEIMTAYMKVLNQRAEIEGVFDKDNKEVENETEIENETENERKIKIFISQNPCFKFMPELKAERNKAIEWIKKSFKEGTYEICQSAFFDGTPEEMHAKKNLDILYNLSCGDVAIFIGNWKDTAGTRLEHKCAKEKGLAIHYIDELDSDELKEVLKEENLFSESK